MQPVEMRVRWASKGTPLVRNDGHRKRPLEVRGLGAYVHEPAIPREG
jgi:hypothetical protein